MRVKLILAAFFLLASSPALSQVAPAATEGGLPLVVGAGFSGFYTDWSGRIDGPIVWAEWNFYRAPWVLNGLGIEVEGRDLNYGRTGSDPRLRLDTGEGGAIYTWRHHRNFHAYGKCLTGILSIDFSSNSPYRHDTRTDYVVGGGVEYRAWHNVWVRGDYEYQFATNFFSHHALNPNGFTIGAAYDFKRTHAH
jgi:opacity protein-like surface antigen